MINQVNRELSKCDVTSHFDVFVAHHKMIWSVVIHNNTITMCSHYITMHYISI